MSDIEKRNQALVRPDLSCVFIRTEMEGKHTSNTRGILRGRIYKVTADVVLCRFCGNLQGTIRGECPERMRLLLLEQ